MKVVNYRKVQSNVNTVCIDRTSIFGNPFRMLVDSDEERDRVIEDYKIWFEKEVDRKMEFRVKVLALRGRDLGCWCAPKPCHGDVIISWLKTHTV